MMTNKKKMVREKFRNSVFKRDGNKCKLCGSKENLEAHHIQDRHLFSNGGYVTSNGITVCPECHVIVEIFHQTGLGITPDELYTKIDSSFEKALKDDSR